MKRLIILIIVIAIIAGSIYVYILYTGKVKSVADLKTEVSTNAVSMLAEFEKDSAAANKKYLGKIVAVEGMIKSIERESATIVLANKEAMASVRCSMDTGYVKEMALLNPSTRVTIKGACTGYNADELGLGSDVVLNRCIIDKHP